MFQFFNRTNHLKSIIRLHNIMSFTNIILWCLFYILYTMKQWKIWRTYQQHTTKHLQGKFCRIILNCGLTPTKYLTSNWTNTNIQVFLTTMAWMLKYKQAFAWRYYSNKISFIAIVLVLLKSFFYFYTKYFLDGDIKH